MNEYQQGLTLGLVFAAIMAYLQNGATALELLTWMVGLNLGKMLYDKWVEA